MTASKSTIYSAAKTSMRKAKKSPFHRNIQGKFRMCNCEEEQHKTFGFFMGGVRGANLCLKIKSLPFSP